MVYPPDAQRCPWGNSTDDYRAYHDEEWGRPITDERGMYERLTLESFQSGLSWLTILRKRQNFRAAFAGFDAERVAAFGEDDFARLMSDRGIVRNRAKIEAAIANARATRELWRTGRSLAAICWAHRRATEGSPPRTANDVPALTQESKALTKELKRFGFRFVGPTTAYALMQAAGIVNDHIASCCVRAEVEAERSEVLGAAPAPPA